MEMPIKVVAGVKLTKNVNTNKNIDNTKIHNYKNFPFQNIGVLKIKMDNLHAIKEDYKENIHADKVDLEKIISHSKQMTQWMEAVERQKEKVDLLVEEEQSAKNKRNFKEKSWRVPFASNVESSLEEVRELENQWEKLKDLVPAVPALRINRPNLPRIKLVGFGDKLNETLKYIKEKEFSIIGIFGAGGIGKTTLLNEIENEFSGKDGKTIAPFTKVIRVHVTNKLDIKRIQSEIASHLELGSFSGLDDNSRAKKLSKALLEQTFLLLLDDIWHTFDIHQIGIPDLKECPQSKIVYSTRLKGICEGMQPHISVQMEYLDPKASMKLFHNARANAAVEDSETLNKIVRKCSGLPLALVVVGNATVVGNLDHIHNSISDSPADIKLMKERVLEVLKPSFDALDVEFEQCCFLFCGLFRDFKDINRELLLEYWIGETLIDDNEGLIQLRAKADNIVEVLLGSCLLEEPPDVACVKMHNIVRSMAVWLANQAADRFTTNQGSDRFYAGDEFDRTVRKMKKLTRLSLIDVEIKKEDSQTQIPNCEHLRTLLMGLDDLRSKIQGQNIPRRPSCEYNIPLSFFSGMPSIKVLDLSGHPIRALRKEICNLKSLRYLNLSFTYIEVIPLYFNGLTNLRQLDLGGTSQLRIIPFKAICSLSNLRSFKLCDSRYKISCSKWNWFRKYKKTSQLSLNDIEKLGNLEELSLSLQRMKTLQKLSESPWLVKKIICLQLAYIEGDLDTPRLFTLLGEFQYLKNLCLKDCHFKDNVANIPGKPLLKLKTLELRDLDTVQIIIFKEEDGKSWHEVVRELRIANCKQLINIKGLCQLQDLQILRIEVCPSIVEIHEDKDQKMYLSKLKLLRLRSLPKLTTISQSAVQFGTLTNMIIHQCSRLKNLPAFEKHTEKVGVSCEEGWWNSLEWRNDNAKSLFKPQFLTTEVQTIEIQTDEQATDDQTAEVQFVVQEDKGKKPLYPNPPPDEGVVHNEGTSQLGAQCTEVILTEVQAREAQTAEIVQATEAQITEVPANEAQTADVVQASKVPIMVQAADVRTAEAQTTKMVQAIEVQATDAQTVEIVQAIQVQAAEAQTTEIVKVIEAQTEVPAVEAQTTEIVHATKAQNTEVQSNESQTTQVQAYEAQISEVVQATEAQTVQSQNRLTITAAHSDGKHKGKSLISISYQAGRKMQVRGLDN